MNLEPTDEQTAVQDTVRKFLAEKASIAEYVRPMLEDPTGYTSAVWRGLSDLGTTGLLVPQQFDGAELTMVEAGIVLETLGEALHPGPWLSTAVAVPRALKRFDATESQGALLSGIANGATIATVALPGGRLPTAVEVDEHVVLRGELDAVPDAAAAGVMLVLARSSDNEALYAVRTAAPGVHMTPIAGIDQTRKQFRVSLKDCPADLVASATPGALEAFTDDLLIAAAADALGAAHAVMTMANEYAKLRRQFGRPIGSFQAVQHLCVDMYETVEFGRSGVVHALWAADSADARERHLAAVRVKSFAGQLARVGDTAVQVFGGIGYTWEHDAHLYLKRLLSWTTFLGGPHRYLRELGAHLTGAARSQSLSNIRSTA